MTQILPVKRNNVKMKHHIHCVRDANCVVVKLIMDVSFGLQQSKPLLNACLGASVFLVLMSCYLIVFYIK